MFGSWGGGGWFVELPTSGHKYNLLLAGLFNVLTMQKDRFWLKRFQFLFVLIVSLFNLQEYQASIATATQSTPQPPPTTTTSTTTTTTTTSSTSSDVITSVASQQVIRYPIIL